MLSDLHDKGLGLLFQTDSAQLKHTLKADTLSGRTITDLKWRVPPILNGDWASEWATNMYGSISYPTIVDVVLMISDTIDRVQLQDPDISLEELHFWKVDIFGAF
jgi:hypothetical protein